jgi:hypothetical protein
VQARRRGYVNRGRKALNFSEWSTYGAEQQGVCKEVTEGQFSSWIALILIAVSGAIGYIGGFVLAALWNWLHREQHQLAPPHGGRLAPVQR